MDPDLLAQRRIGTILRGKWRLTKLLGVGGMAAVYVGEHTIGRREAIKILHPEVARSRELRARFEQEAHAVNRLKHPGVVAIHDIDATEDGAPFLVMELLEGESLLDRAARLGGIETDELLRLVDELLDVLGAAHAQGIVHRDIKLDNLFVRNDGRLKVLDFGIARLRDGSNGDLRTRTGAALGTVPYMAPEQIKGVGVDARVDLFAVGATMFRLVAKRRVHEAESEAMMMIKMATEPAPKLASVAPGAPPGLCLVVDRALQFERDQRYPDAAIMRRDVQALRAGLPPPYASALAVEGSDERTAAAAPIAMAAAAAIPDAPAPPMSIAQPAATWSPAALERTHHAGAAGPASLAAIAATSALPVAASTSAETRAGEERKLLAIVLASLAALLVLVLVVVLVRKGGGSSEISPGAAQTGEAPTGVDPDDPAWRPSPAYRPGTKPTATPAPRKRHGHGRGGEDD